MKFFCSKRLLAASAALLALVFSCQVADACPALSGPTLTPHKKFHNRINVKVSVEYLETSGYTVVNASGIHYHINGMGVIDGALSYPEQFWADDYPLYLIGHTMVYRIYVKNKTNRALRNLRVLGIQEYLNPSGKDGVDIGGCSTEEWIVPKIAKKKTWVGEGSFWIPGGTSSGLDQTHVQIQNFINALCKPTLLWDRPQVGLFCPPE